MGYELILFTGVVTPDVEESPEEVKKAEKKKRKVKSKIASIQHQTDVKKAAIAHAAARIQQMDSELQAENSDLADAYRNAQATLDKLVADADAREKMKRDEEVIIDEEKDDPLEGFEEVVAEIEDTCGDPEDDDDDPEMRTPENREQRRKRKREEESAKRAKEIKTIYRKIVARTHPDRIGGSEKHRPIYERATKAKERGDLETLKKIWLDLSITASALLEQLLEQLASAERELLMTVAMHANLQNSEQYMMMTDWFGGAKGPVGMHFRKMLQGRLNQLYARIDQMRPPVDTVNERDDGDNADDDEFKEITWHLED